MLEERLISETVESKQLKETVSDLQNYITYAINILAYRFFQQPKDQSNDLIMMASQMGHVVDPLSFKDDISDKTKKLLTNFCSLVDDQTRMNTL